MKPPNDVRREALAAAAEELSLTLDQRSTAILIGYLDLLERWNATYNLTAVRRPDDMLVQHLFDCLAAIPPLRREFPGPLRLLDVGSGGGLPGLVIAALCPDANVVCLDAVGKKIAFIRQAAMELSLSNLTAEHARIEAVKLLPFDVVTSRAFASLPEFVRATRKHLSTHGVWMAMKGKRPDEELAQVPADVAVFHVEPLRVPELNAERCLVWMRVQN